MSFGELVEFLPRQWRLPAAALALAAATFLGGALTWAHAESVVDARVAKAMSSGDTHDALIRIDDRLARIEADIHDLKEVVKEKP